MATALEQQPALKAILQVVKKPFKRLLKSSKSAVVNKMLDQVGEKIQDILKTAIKAILEKCASIENVDFDSINEVLRNFSFERFINTVTEKFSKLTNFTNANEIMSIVEELQSLDELEKIVIAIYEKIVEKKEEETETNDDVVDKISKAIADYLTELIIDVIKNLLIKEENEDMEELDKTDKKEEIVGNDEPNDVKVKETKKITTDESINEEEKGEKTRKNKKSLRRLMNFSKQQSTDKILGPLKKEFNSGLKNRIKSMIDEEKLKIFKLSGDEITTKLQIFSENSSDYKKLLDAISSKLSNVKGIHELVPTVKLILEMEILKTFVAAFLKSLNDELDDQNDARKKKREEVVRNLCNRVADFVTNATLELVKEKYV